MINATIEKFGYPATLIRDYRHWVLLLRPAQVTAGSLVLAAKGAATAYGDLSAEAFAEQGRIVADIERMLGAAIGYDRINYLMLMMVDPHVHFHVVPRYAGTRSIAGRELADAGWPGPPDLRAAVAFDDAEIAAAVSELKAASG